MEPMKLTTAFSTTHTEDRSLSGLQMTFIILGVAFLCSMILWTVVYATTTFRPYHVAGFSLPEDVVCPTENVVIDVVDELRDISPLIDMTNGRVEIKSSFVGVTGEPSYSELTFPIDLTHMRNGGETSFARIAPDQPGQYIIRSRAVVKGTVAKFPFPRTAEFPITDNDHILTVKSPLDTECEAPVTGGDA